MQIEGKKKLFFFFYIFLTFKYCEIVYPMEEM